MRYILIIGFILSLVSCKKYTHHEPVAPNCNECSLADSLNGTYRGIAGGFQVPDNPPGSYSDSLTMTVEHIFLGNSQYEDSTVMHFKTSFKYDSSGDTIFDTVQVDLSTGVVANEAFRKYATFTQSIWGDGTGYYFIEADSIRLNCEQYDGMQSITYVISTLQKQ
jgi:hypothetical protein